MSWCGARPSRELTFAGQVASKLTGQIQRLSPQVMDMLGPSLWDTWNQKNQQCATEDLAPPSQPLLTPWHKL